MPSRKPARATRRLLKLASLGIAGLLAGLLSGCSSSVSNVNLASYSQTPGWQANSNGSYTSPHQNHDAHPIPDFKRAPTPHRMESWAFRTPQAPVVTSQIDPGRTLTNYDFTGESRNSNSGSGRMALQ